MAASLRHSLLRDCRVLGKLYPLTDALESLHQVNEINKRVIVSLSEDLSVTCLFKYLGAKMAWMPSLVLDTLYHCPEPARLKTPIATLFNYWRQSDRRQPIKQFTTTESLIDRSVSPMNAWLDRIKHIHERTRPDKRLIMHGTVLASVTGLPPSLRILSRYNITYKKCIHG
jgi:hypothetical protein